MAFDGNRYSVPWRLVGKPLTLRADAETVTLWYGTHRVARHARCWRRGVEVVLPAHADGLLATKPGAQAHWQVEARAGARAPRPRSTSTASGPAPARSGRSSITCCSSPRSTARSAVEAALAACLAQAIVGSHQVEQWLRLQDTPPVAPPPLTLGDPRLTVPPVRPNLQRYDALLLDADPEEAPMATPTLEEKLTQLQLMSAPAFLAAWGERHPAERGAVREVLEGLVDRELTRRSEQKVAARIKAARFVQLQTVETFHFDYSPATRKLRSRYLNLLATDLVAEGIGALFVGGSGLGQDASRPGAWATPSASAGGASCSPRSPPW